MRPAASRTDSIHQSTNRPMMNSACPPRCPLHSLCDTPYLGPNDTRMSPNTFYGYSLIGNDGDESPMGRATTTALGPLLLRSSPRLQRGRSRSCGRRATALCPLERYG